MIAMIRRPYGWAKVFSVLLIAAFAFALLDAFVIPKSYNAVGVPAASEPATEPELTINDNGSAEPSAILDEQPPSVAEPVLTATSYTDENIQINIETVEEHSTVFYVADIRISDPACLKTALAQDTYGRNLKDTTSAMAAEQNAIFAVNGDYYGFRDTGYVLRNGTLYRAEGSGDALVIDYDGRFFILEQSEITDEIIASAWQIFSFGPALVEDGAVAVDASSEVSRSKTSNPRTAIGQVAQGHYIFIVSDGRTEESEGLSLMQLAGEFEERGAVTAYNLDGGGSSTMVFAGEVVNTPTNGRSYKEREVSDIVYIGYE